MTRKPTLIGFFGGPGCGKSTAALTLTSKMKDRAYKAEFASEYAKNLAWNKSEVLTRDVAFPIILGRQIERIFLPCSGCDFVITDSPPWLGIAYAKKYGYDTDTNEPFIDYARRLHGNGYGGIFESIIDIQLERGDRKYLKCGRSQTKDEAKELDERLAEHYAEVKKEYKIPFLHLQPQGKFTDSCESVLATILKYKDLKD